MKTVVAIHTAMAMVEPTKELFQKHLPGVRLINIVDDSLIQDVIRDGEVKASVESRIRLYYRAAVDAGADVIFNTCSSVGEVAIAARKTLPVPLVKIDDAMARKAVKEYKKIGVMATLSTTLNPTIKLISRFAREMSADVTVTEGLVDGAFQSLMDGNLDDHDQKVLNKAQEISSQVDVILLAQGSMARVENTIIARTGKPVLTSPLLGVLEVKSTLEQLN
ncbi:MAG: hypothetical protein JXR52_05610 [Bacteroidales bacterium]|nr:hypothetical protein [Bacteroidales bacterium]MBN2698283.1 hypothetical protein [Bacteroidales bacterium]